ncbi:MAG TPA: hypothetical protein VF929_05380 [Gemmatimonadaceae bacterium]
MREDRKSAARASRGESARRGTAIVLALALLTLAAALLAGTASSAHVAAVGAIRRQAAMLADAQWRADAAAYLGRWGTPEDALAIGGELTVVVGPRPLGVNGAMATTRIRLLRIQTLRYLVGVEVRIGEDAALLAVRRGAILLQRPASADSTLVPPPVPVARWAQANTY